MSQTADDWLTLRRLCVSYGSMTLSELLAVSVDGRDESWEDQFLLAFSAGTLRVLSPDPQTGPDGWPYFFVETTSAGESGSEPAQKILSWLSTRGMGLAINPQKETPDYVLSWGMIWCFRETGRFFRRDLAHASGPLTANLESIAHAGTPSPQYLPDYVRKIVKDFFRDQGVHSPRILVFSLDKVHYELGFSLESLGNPPESEWEGIAEAISWFLPPHYSVVLMSEKNQPPFSAL